MNEYSFIVPNNVFDWLLRNLLVSLYAETLCDTYLYLYFSSESIHSKLHQTLDWKLNAFFPFASDLY